MQINKIVLNTDTGEQVLVDLTADTVTADALVEGYTAHGMDGEAVHGSNPYEKTSTDAEVQTQADLIAQIQAALEHKAAGGIAPIVGMEIGTITGSATRAAPAQTATLYYDLGNIPDISSKNFVFLTTSEKQYYVLLSRENLLDDFSCAARLDSQMNGFYFLGLDGLILSASSSDSYSTLTYYAK